jgi:Fur family ferric uptake transcriptional regulator
VTISKERQTRQRQAIRDAIDAAGVPLSPREILDAAQSRVTGIGMATVYRTLKLLADAGIVQAVDIPGESPRYEMAGKGHHHHFYCRACGKVFEVEGCPGDFSALTPPKFKLEGHELVLFGTCGDCSKPGRTRARP